MMSEYKYNYLYRYSFQEAQRANEFAKWKDSHLLNKKCRDFLDKQIKSFYDDSSLDKKAIRQTVEEFGFDRTMWVLANQIQHMNYDGRYSHENKEWAAGIYIPRPTKEELRDDYYLVDHTRSFLLEAHPSLINILTDQVRKMYAELNLYDHQHCNLSEKEFAGKILILRASSLNEASRTPDNQLFLAGSGFGCSPDLIGRAVFGQFLIDGEKARFNRTDFIGVANEKYLPEWALEAFEAYKQEQAADDGPSDEPVMKGI